MIAHQHLQQHPPKSVPNSTRPSIEHPRHHQHPPNSIPKQHLQQHPKLHALCTLPSISQICACTVTLRAPPTAPPQTPSRTPNPAPAPQAACPLAPYRQDPRASISQIAPAPSPSNSSPNSIPKHHQHQHPKLHAPVHPTVKMQ